MSAFMVSNKTIDVIVTGMMRWLCHDNTDRERWLYRFGIDPMSDGEYETTLGLKLLALNRDAVNQRYREKEVAPEYTYKHVAITREAAVKQLQCLIYQCSEGTVPETPTYNVLQDLERAMLSRIVSSLPEYVEAPWGF